MPGRTKLTILEKKGFEVWHDIKSSQKNVQIFIGLQVLVTVHDKACENPISLLRPEIIGGELTLSFSISVFAACFAFPTAQPWNP